METIEDLLRQLKKQPYRPDIHNKLGQLYQQQKESAEAAKHYLSAARLFTGQNSPGRNLNKAIVILKKMLRDFPDNQDSYYLLAETYTEMNDHDSAVMVYESLSDWYRKDGKLIMAVSVFDKVTDFLPENIDAWIKFASLNEEAGMPFHAAQGFIKAARLTNDLKESCDFCIKALRLDPENSDAVVLLGSLTESDETSRIAPGPIYDLAVELESSGHESRAVSLLEVLAENLDDSEAERKARSIRDRMEKGKEPEAKQVEEKKPRSLDLEGRKVLVIDDEREILLLLEQILKEEGLNVLTARDGQEGLEVFLRERPSLVVTDAMLPKLHGFELSRRIKEESDYKARIMILTAVYKKYKYKAKIQDEYKVDEYMDKPFQIGEFLDLFYRMAEGVQDLPAGGTGSDGPDPVYSAPLTIMVVSGGDRDLSSKVSGFCQRKGFIMMEANDSIGMVKKLEAEVPDILLITDSLKDMDPYFAAWMVRNVLEIRSTTMVLVSRDVRSLNVEAGKFNHRVAAPIDSDTMDNIVGLHNSSADKNATKGKEISMTRLERRIEAVLKSKVDGILETHYQVEERYNKRINELQKKIGKLRSGPGGTIESGE